MERFNFFTASHFYIIITKTAIRTEVVEPCVHEVLRLVFRISLEISIRFLCEVRKRLCLQNLLISTRLCKLVNI